MKYGVKSGKKLKDLENRINSGGDFKKPVKILWTDIFDEKDDHSDMVIHYKYDNELMYLGWLVSGDNDITPEEIISQDQKQRAIYAAEYFLSLGNTDRQIRKYIPEKEEDV